MKLTNLGYCQKYDSHFKMIKNEWMERNGGCSPTCPMCRIRPKHPIECKGHYHSLEVEV